LLKITAALACTNNDTRIIHKMTLLTATLLIMAILMTFNKGDITYNVISYH
jgi:hypothetical protein